MIGLKRHWFGYLIVGVSLVCILGWVYWGYILFFSQTGYPYIWARGELGDFLGGGLGGIAVVIVIYTLWLQICQLTEQRNETFEAGVFRMFDVLQPEVQNLSARIISKLIINKLVKEDDESFDKMLHKYHERGDKTVFLRAMQKEPYCEAIQLKKYDDEELVSAIDRFENIMQLLCASLKKISDHTDDDFAKAIEATEIYQTYKKCFN